METIGKIRRCLLVKGESIRRIARDLKLSRNTVRKYLTAEGEVGRGYVRTLQPQPKPGAFQSQAVDLVNQLKREKQLSKSSTLARQLTQGGQRSSMNRIICRSRIDVAGGRATRIIPVLFYAASMPDTIATRRTGCRCRCAACLARRVQARLMDWPRHREACAGGDRHTERGIPRSSKRGHPWPHPTWGASTP